MKTITNKFKLTLVAVGLLAIGSASAQTTTGSIGKQTDATLNSSNTAVKVIDNKGTIKYLQAANGLTSFTDTNPAGGEVTTWQLGGTLTSATNIATGANEFKVTLDAGGTFVLDGLVQETGIASDATTIGTSGWTLLVRDEATGQVKKLLASDIVSGIRIDGPPQAANVTTGTTDITVTGLPVLTAGTSAAKLFVYRNGAKLRFGTDFSVTANTVTFDNTVVPFYIGDIIEIQYIK